MVLKRVRGVKRDSHHSSQPLRMEEIIRLLSSVPRNVEEYGVGESIGRNHFIAAIILPYKVNMQSIRTSQSIRRRKVPTRKDPLLCSFYCYFCFKNSGSSVHM